MANAFACGDRVCVVNYQGPTHWHNGMEGTIVAFQRDLIVVEGDGYDGFFKAHELAPVALVIDPAVVELGYN